MFRQHGSGPGDPVLLNFLQENLRVAPGLERAAALYGHTWGELLYRLHSVRTEARWGLQDRLQWSCEIWDFIIRY